MINLRFHIVSITAVFLALAIGIFMGTSLLKRATVDSLKATQHSLELKIDQSDRQNDGLSDALNTSDAQAKSFSTSALGSLLGGQLRDPVLLVAARGIDEDTVSAVRNVLTDAGSANLGTIWLDSNTSFDSSSLRQAVADALGTTVANAATTRKRFVDAFGGALKAATVRVPSSNDEATTTTVASSIGDPNQVINALAKAGALSWDAPAQGEPVKLPADDLRVVVLSGENSAVSANDVLYPLLRATVGGAPGSTIAGEIMSPRSSVAEVQRTVAGTSPARGAFVDPIRKDPLHNSVATIDDLDSPYGRLALVMVLAATPGSAVGSYGIGSGSSAQYPSGTP